MTATKPPTNWGRWGDADQLGTLNLIDDAARKRAAVEVRDALHVSLARRTDPVPLTTGLSPVPSPAMMPAGVLQAVNFTGAKPVAMTDTLLINTHTATLTHIDAVAHMPIAEHVYPGVPLSTAVTPTGVKHGSADPFGAGVVTRGSSPSRKPGGNAAPPTKDYPPVGLPVLRAVVVAGILPGAEDLDDAVQVLRQLPGLSTAGDSLLRDLAQWLWLLYPHMAGGWLDPHLPARLTEHYIATNLATNPPLLAVIAAATLPTTPEPAPGPLAASRPTRVLTLLAAAHHTPTAAQTVRTLLHTNPQLLPTAIQVALAGDGPIDQSIAAAITDLNLNLNTDQLADLDRALPETPTQTLLHPHRDEPRTPHPRRHQ